MNIQIALRQMRNSRKLGKLSLSQQDRIMRRIQPRESVLNWERLNALRAQIDSEVAPILQAKREAEHKSFQVRWQPETEMPAEPAPLALIDKLFFLKEELKAKRNRNRKLALA